MKLEGYPNDIVDAARRYVRGWRWGVIVPYDYAGVELDLFKSAVQAFRGDDEAKVN